MPEHRPRIANDQTAERIAEAAELSAALLAYRFFTELSPGADPGADRIKELVRNLAARMCKRHGV